MRTKKIIIPIYHTRAVFIESSDFDEVVEYFKKVDYNFHNKSNELFASVVDHHIVVKGEKYLCLYLIFNPRYKFSPFEYSVIAHEAVHAASAIFDRKGAKYYDDEPFAYLVEYFFSETCKFLGIKDEIK